MLTKSETVKNDNVWELVKQGLLDHFGSYVFDNWIVKLSYLRSTNNGVVLTAPTSFVREWIVGNYLQEIHKEFSKHQKVLNFVDIIVSNTLEPKTIEENSSPNLARHENDNTINSNLDPRFTFDNFIVGSSNQLAYMAALSVAEAQEAIPKSNPLFLYGGVGLGKTHLMNSIAWYIKNKNPHRKVLYMSAEKFMYHFVSALRNKSVLSFKEYFRSVDVLMIDDIQFICGKDSTQEEFFHTFNTLIDNHRQIVISCDRSPTDLDNIEDRIRSRLGWGLVADVHKTTYELRLGILESKLEQLQICIPDQILNFLATKVTSNVRELEGALNKIIAHTSLSSAPITLETSQYLLKDLIKANSRPIAIEDIQKKVSERYNIKLTDIVSSKKVRSIAWPRQIAMYLAKLLTPKSLADIAQNFGKKDHTTIMHAIKKVEESMEKNEKFKEEIDLLTKMLQN